MHDSGLWRTNGFYQNLTLNPVLVLSSKYPCHSNLIFFKKKKLIQLTINPAYCHPDTVEGVK